MVLSSLMEQLKSPVLMNPIWNPLKQYYYKSWHNCQHLPENYQLFPKWKTYGCFSINEENKAATSQMNFYTTKGLFHERMSFLQKYFDLYIFVGRNVVHAGVWKPGSVICVSLTLNTVHIWFKSVLALMHEVWLKSLTIT